MRAAFAEALRWAFAGIDADVGLCPPVRYLRLLLIRPLTHWAREMNLPSSPTWQLSGARYSRDLFFPFVRPSSQFYFNICSRRFQRSTGKGAPQTLPSPHNLSLPSSLLRCQRRYPWTPCANHQRVPRVHFPSTSQSRETHHSGP